MTQQNDIMADFELWFNSLLEAQTAPQLRSVILRSKEVLFQNWRSLKPNGAFNGLPDEPSMKQLQADLALNFSANEFECGYPPAHREIVAFKSGMTAIADSLNLSKMIHRAK